MSWKHDADREAQQSGEYVESSFNVRYLTIEVASLARAGLDKIYFFPCCADRSTSLR